VTTDAKLCSIFDAVIILVKLCPSPDLFTLLAIVTDVLVVQVHIVFHDQLLSLVYELNYNRSVRVFDVENDCFVPDWRRSKSKICLGVGVILDHLHLMLPILEILRVNDVNFQL